MTKTEKMIQKFNKNNISIPEGIGTTIARLYEQTGLLMINDDGLLFIDLLGERNLIPKAKFQYVECERHDITLTSVNGHGYTITNVEFPDTIVEIIAHNIEKNILEIKDIFKKVNPSEEDVSQTGCYDVLYQCPECWEKVSAKTYHYIEITKDNFEIKNRMLEEKEEFFECECTKCGNKIKLMYPLQYVDTEKQLQILLLPDRHVRYEDFLNYVPEFKERPGYTSRLVTDFSYLLETISLFDEGLNDRLVQVFKLTCWLDFIHSDPKFENAVSVYQWYLGSKNGTISIMFVYRILEETNTILWEVPESYYIKIKDRFEEKLSQTKPFEKVGYAYAVQEYLLNGDEE